MAEGDELLADDNVIRRFDPTDERRCTFDEAGRPSKLKAFALKWDPDDESPPLRKECSVYQESKLREAGHAHSVCIEEDKPHWAVAIANVGQITTFTRAAVEASNPFSVVEAPYPLGSDGHVRDSAHANIVHSIPLRGSDGWYRDLALKFKTLL